MRWVYLLSRAADEDLIQIYVSGAESFGLDQARRYHRQLFAAFSFLAENPRVAHLRDKIKPPVRAYPVGSHIVIYTVRQNNDVFVLRIRHAREDWLSPRRSR